MSTESCPSCGHPISSDADGRFPPWCPRCGTDFKRPHAPPAATPAVANGPAVAVHAVTEPRVYHGSHNGRGFPTGPNYPPHIGGPATVTSTVWGRCWKQHTCVECGGVYRYKIVREAGAESRYAEFARQEAEAKLFRRLAREVDPNPCPSCGLIQPDMVGQGKRRGHALATAAAGLLLAVVVGVTYVWGGFVIDDVAAYAAAIAGGAAVAHLVVALSNPNRDRAANLRRAEMGVAAGRVEIVARGTVTDSLPPTANLTARHVLALACVVLAAPAFLIPVFVRAANGWTLDREFPPGVISPGDEVTITLPTPAEMKSADGRWRGEAIAELLNTPAIGGPATLSATSRSDSWGQVFDTRRSNVPLTTVWARVQIPDDPALGGQALQVQLTLMVVYPVDEGAQVPNPDGRDWNEKLGFENRTASLTRDVTLTLADAGGSRRYRESWVIGMAFGFFGSLAGGGALIGLAAAMRRRALPAEVSPLHSADGVT